MMESRVMEELRKIREENYEKTKNMSIEERLKYMKKRAKRAEEYIKKARADRDLRNSKVSENEREDVSYKPESGKL